MGQALRRYISRVYILRAAVAYKQCTPVVNRQIWDLHVLAQIVGKVRSAGCWRDPLEMGWVQELERLDFAGQKVWRAVTDGECS